MYEVSTEFIQTLESLEHELYAEQQLRSENKACETIMTPFCEKLLR